MFLYIANIKGNEKKRFSSYTNNDEKDDKKLDDEENDAYQEDINLRYGDIIYFKYYRDKSKGIISGKKLHLYLHKIKSSLNQNKINISRLNKIHIQS